MKPLKLSFALIFAFTFYCLSGCQTKKSKPSPELLSIDLLRGDITLCGDPEFGEVKFTLSCDYSVRETFDLAVSLLHSFEYKEAEKAFVQVIDADPDCAMAYWGIAMSMYHALWFAPSEDDLKKGSELLLIAESLQKSEREEEYLQAIGAFYEDWDEIVHQERAARMENKMAEVYKKYPDDTEAAIFYALALRSTADINDLEYTNQKKAGKILENIFPNQPNHPGIAHYIIHNYDYPELASMALSTARRYADIAPASAHAQHMPSHIFTRLGLWDESIQSNLSSASAAQCYAEQTQMDGHWDEEVHAMDYLVYAYLQQGDNKRANEQYQYLQSIEKLISLTGPYNFGAIPVRIALENKQWQQAAEMSLHESDVHWQQWQWEIALVHFARALGASHIGELKRAENEIIILKSLQQELIEAGEGYKAAQVFIQIKASQAWLDFAKGNNELAIALMKEATDLEENTEKHPKTPGEVLPASELLGDMLLAMNDPSEALKAYEIDLKGHPNRFNGIYGAAVAAKNMGDEEKALEYFEMLLTLTEGSASDRAEIEEAKEFISASKNLLVSELR
jgi:tetratricopeptide (TPR) repeat protein